jgi:hypothetical protein
MLSRKYRTIFCTLLLFIQACQSVYGQDTPLTIITKETLDFGVISNEGGTCAMNGQGQLSGKGGQSCLGSGTRSKFQVRGEPGFAFFIIVTGGSSSGVTFNPKIKGAASKALNSKGRKTVRIIGDLVITSSSTGSLSIPYVMSVNYE